MGRPSYVCTVCSEHFTRKYSAKRHNRNLHNGAAEIVRLIEYLVGRGSGQYMASHPFWHRRSVRSNNFRHATVIADSIGNTFEPRYIPEQAPLGRQYSANSIYPPRQVMDDQSFSGLSLDTIVKIDEVRRLMNKYPKYHMNPDGIIHWAIHSSFNGDNKFLDDKLEQLRTIDSLTKYYDS